MNWPEYYEKTGTKTMKCEICSKDFGYHHKNKTPICSKCRYEKNLKKNREIREKVKKYDDLLMKGTI